VVILFGKMAIDQFLGGGVGLNERIGRRFEKDGRVCIPLPHSSGASTWLNQPANKELLQKAIDLIREETLTPVPSPAEGLPSGTYLSLKRHPS
jgi:uracil-DNA glycosylase